MTLLMSKSYLLAPRCLGLHDVTAESSTSIGAALLQSTRIPFSSVYRRYSQRLSTAGLPLQKVTPALGRQQQQHWKRWRRRRLQKRR